MRFSSTLSCLIVNRFVSHSSIRFLSLFFFPAHHPALPSSPTRRSSDLADSENEGREDNGSSSDADDNGSGDNEDSGEEDRKSTRLNSSHVAISYAVFCLKKKKKKTTQVCVDR